MLAIVVCRVESASLAPLEPGKSNSDPAKKKFRHLPWGWLRPRDGTRRKARGKSSVSWIHPDGRVVQVFGLDSLGPRAMPAIMQAPLRSCSVHGWWARHLGCGLAEPRRGRRLAGAGQTVERSAIFGREAAGDFPPGKQLVVIARAVDGVFRLGPPSWFNDALGHA